MTKPRLHIFVGKGGVGKTTVSLAAASFFARSGKTLFLETGPRSSAALLLDVAPLKYQPRMLAPNLWGAKLTGPEALREYLIRQIRLESVYKLFFENRPVRFFFEAAPALSDLMVLGKVVHEMDRQDPPGPYDHIVLDAPATGHSLFLFKTPKIARELTRLGPVFEHAAHIGDVLASRSVTDIYVVTLVRPIVVGETIELCQELKTTGMPLKGIIVNRTLPDTPIPKKRGSNETDLLGLLSLRAKWENREIRRIRHLTRLPLALLEESTEDPSLSRLADWYSQPGSVP